MQILIINIYPNPSSDVLNLEVEYRNKSIEFISIFNRQGKRVKSQQINSAQVKLNVSNLANGLNIVEGITSTGESFSGKFIKE